MNTVMFAKQPSSLSQLNDELREFSEILRMVRYQPTLEEAIAAVKPHFPELTLQAQTVEQVLDPVGLVVIVDMGQGIDPKRISWSAARTKEEAENQQTKYMAESYRSIRKALGIDSHWVCLVFDGFLGDSDSVLIEGCGNFRAVGEPECWIFDLLATG
jgi:hypothetical protein